MNYYLHRALFKAGFFKKINVTTTVTIRGRSFLIPVVREAGYHNVMRHEPWMIELFAYLLASREGAVIDVGMNIGQTLLKVSAVDPARRYLGFEPNPLCCYVCKGIITANQLAPCEVFPIGLSERTELVTLFMDKDYASGASVLEDFRENKARYHQRLNIAVFRGDEVPAIQREAAIALVKVDVEGAELEVIRGLRETLARAQPFVVLEILPVYTLERPNGRYRKGRQDQLLTTLRELGYRTFLIHEDDRSLEPLDDIAVHGDMRRTNYLFAHESMAARLPGRFSTPNSA